MLESVKFRKFIMNNYTYQSKGNLFVTFTEKE